MLAVMTNLELETILQISDVKDTRMEILGPRLCQAQAQVDVFQIMVKFPLPWQYSFNKTARKP
jgi:hypothetical protein